MTVALSQLNFRDLGGLPTRDGRRLRPGMLYRSEGPASFAAEHQHELQALGIRLICDLRAEVERRAAPHDDGMTARRLHLDLANDLRSETNEGWSALRNDPSEAGARAAMQLNYAAMPAALLPHLRGFVDAIIAGETPVLMHCTAGKDRTGVLVALLLTVLGVPEDVVVADYLRSDVFAKNLRLGGSIAHAFEQTFGFTPSEATINAMIGVDPGFLAAALHAVTVRHGSVERYFASAGIGEAQLAQLCATLLADGDQTMSPERGRG
jgi:protein-tyrosine phosphatase